MILQKLLAPAQQERAIEKTDEIETHDDLLKVLVFHLDQERYGIPIENVIEIIRYTEATEVPHTVHFLEGIISLHGEMIPVINGRKRLGHQGQEPDKRTRIVILKEDNNRYGIIVDSTHQVVRLSRKNIEPTPPVVGMDAAFIQGVCEHHGQLIILLQLKRFLEFTS